MRNVVSIAAVFSFGLCAQPTIAAEKSTSRPEIFQQLVDCRKLTDSESRLACYDSQVAKLEVAESKRELILVEKQQVKEAKKGLFGFSVPKIPFLSDDENGEEGPSFIEDTIAGVRPLSDGQWQFRLGNGAVWRQIEVKAIPDPKVGDPIRIRKAALGSYLANIKGRVAIRVKREN